MPYPSDATEPVPTPIGQAWIESCVIHHHIADGTVVTESLAEKTVAKLAGFVGDRRLPAVVDIRGVTFADRAARDVFARDLGFELATALVVSSGFTKNLGNIYLRLSRPGRPTKMFNSSHEPTRWAEAFIT